jgi:hypothetical protein
VKELNSIVDITRFTPPIDMTVFPGTKSFPYWSSSTYFDNPYYAWVVNFFDGFVIKGSKMFTYYVRCVR